MGKIYGLARVKRNSRLHFLHFLHHQWILPIKFWIIICDVMIVTEFIQQNQWFFVLYKRKPTLLARMSFKPRETKGWLVKAVFFSSKLFNKFTESILETSGTMVCVLYVIVLFTSIHQTSIHKECFNNAPLAFPRKCRCVYEHQTLWWWLWRGLQLARCKIQLSMPSTILVLMIMLVYNICGGSQVHPANWRYGVKC